MGVSEGTIRKWEKGLSDPQRSYLIAIAEATGVSLEWLMTGRGPMTKEETWAPDEEFVRVPLYDVKVSAGDGRLIEEEPIKTMLAFRADWLRRQGLQPSHLALVYVEGDSMYPTLQEGDLLLLDTSKRTPVGGVYVIQIEGELRAKRIQRLVDGSVRISSDNPAYAEERLPAGEVGKLQVIGRAVWKCGALR